ncbi:N-acetylmuramoyl-L-alanine amidase [Nostoc sp. FACHB-152]|uniref:N-acetylmuramoyl-L-alanine amidase n=1 Tax=unclassified Nostoc TaxID=2593658 RepID=UPI001685765A|nr:MULTISPECIES: peptidoglycan recognition family protein [unclassified Nostoc]MBD2447684.1 N-acetylmuramoyl-L-alanine amidase [Nostoc sp. FACHB-152]MBD2466976.1 N-acetylmuramoyl-L-alanine amidase [Nostoc sp. FACHB-145]
MRFSDWATRVSLIFFMLAALMLVLSFGKAKQLPKNITTANPDINVWSRYPQIKAQQIESKGDKAQKLLKTPEKTKQQTGRYTTTEAFASYTPRYEVAAVDSSNYGDRYTQDINGIPVNNQPIIVIHETGYSAASAINFFQNRHDDESVQASYHTLIKLDGTVVYLVPPEKRAFGAANSVFEGLYGAETVQTNPNLPPSVNNFAYHVSLETPPDGRGDNYIKAHSGYTEAQYHSLAWLIAQSQIPEDRITTHQAVDRSGQKIDPISFDFDKLLTLLNTYREISPVYRVQR